MMEKIAGYFISIVAAAMLAATAQSMIPSGKIRKIAALTSGALLLILVLTPFLSLDELQLSLDFSGFLSEQTQQVEQMQSENETKIAELIKQTSEEYISDKALELGVSITPQVTLMQAAEGYSYPYSVTLTGYLSEAQKNELSSYLTAVLGIPKERQVFAAR